MLGLDDVDDKLADLVCAGDASLSVNEDDGADELVLWADELETANDSCEVSSDTEASSERKSPNPEFEGMVLVDVAADDVEPDAQAKISSWEDDEDTVDDDDDDDTVDNDNVDNNGAEDVETEDVVDVDFCFGEVVDRTTDSGVTDAVSISPNS
ncbi:hypothetical protein EV180_004314, partial [Coemansia sp. RSA 518]